MTTMQANVGDRILIQSRQLGANETVEIVEVRGEDGALRTSYAARMGTRGLFSPARTQ
jgi:hypothetical protein